MPLTTLRAACALLFAPIWLPLAAQDAELARARQVNLERAASMPNFVADEVSKRYSSNPGSSRWKFLDTIEAEITIHGTGITRQGPRRNGKPWNRGDSGFGFLPGTGFGAELKPLFDPECPTTLEFAGREQVGGKPALAYRFTSPADGCFSVLSSNKERYNAARTGRVLVEEAAGKVLRFEEEATGLPEDYNFVQRNQVVTWGDVKTGSGVTWLPAAAEFIWRLRNGTGYRVTVEYKNPRHFEAATSISFSGSPDNAAPPPARSLDGVWRSQGYGYIYLIQGSDLHSFEVTSKSCLPGFTATRDNTPIPGREATFQTPGTVFFVRSGDPGDHKRLHEDGSASDIRIARVERIPPSCDHPTGATPLENFDVFAQTFAEHYISFDLKRVNWEKVVAENRRKVTSRTTPSQLFDILSAMIEPFGDAHTSINAPDLRRHFGGIRPGTDRVMKGGSGEFETHGMRALLAVSDRYLSGPLRKLCNGQIEYGYLDEATGYLRILSFSGYSEQGGFAEGMTALESALDEIFADPALKSLVIDVRINFGGSDPYGLAIAARLATAEYVAYSKEARANAGQGGRWTASDPSIVRPSSQPGFRGPVVELTGPLTISAGETFTQALMGRTPQILRIGENTQGVFSDVLVRRLPNGWTFGLPNEVYRTAKGTKFDGPGIPPDVALPVFADEDIAAGKDPGIAKALELLRHR